MPVPANYGGQGPSCFDRVKMGFMMGMCVGMASGAIFGGFNCLRFGLRGRELISQVGKVMVTYRILILYTYSGGVPSKSKFSNSSFTRSFSLAMNVKVHCWITFSGFKNTGALKLPFFDFARLVDSNVISQAIKRKEKIILSIY